MLEDVRLTPIHITTRRDQTTYNFYVIETFIKFCEAHSCKKNISFEQYHNPSVNTHADSIQTRWRHQFAVAWRQARIEAIRQLVMPKTSPRTHLSDTPSPSHGLVADRLFAPFVSEYIIPLIVDYEDGLNSLGDEISSSFLDYLRNSSANKWQSSYFTLFGWVETVGLIAVGLLGLLESMLLPTPGPVPDYELLSSDTTYTTEVIPNGYSIHSGFHVKELRIGLTVLMIGVLISHIVMAWKTFLKRRHVGRHFECLSGHKRAAMLVPWIVEGFNLPNILIFSKVIPPSMTFLFAHPAHNNNDDDTNTGFQCVCPSRLKYSHVVWLVMPYYIGLTWMIGILQQNTAAFLLLVGPIVFFFVCRYEIFHARLAPYNYHMVSHFEMIERDHPIRASTAQDLETVLIDDECDIHDLDIPRSPTHTNISGVPPLTPAGAEHNFEDEEEEEEEEADESDEDALFDDDILFRRRHTFVRTQTCYENVLESTDLMDLDNPDWKSEGGCKPVIQYRGMISLDCCMLLAVYPLMLMLPFTMSLGLLCELHIMWNKQFSFQYFIHYWYLFLGVKISFGTIISTLFHCLSPSDWRGPRDGFYALSFWALSLSTSLFFMARIFGTHSFISAAVRCFLWIVFYVWAKSVGLMRIQAYRCNRDLSFAVITRLLCWFQTNLVEIYNDESAAML